MLSKKAESIKPSVTLGISSRVKSLKAKGVDVINLSIGEPDFETPVQAKQAAIEAINANMTKYDTASGNLELKKAICADLLLRHSLEYDPAHIVVSSGAKQSITNTLLALLDPGDEVIIPVPYWVSYPEMVGLCGGKTVFVETKKSDGLLLSLEELKKSITDKTKIIILNNPSNPTGNIYDKDKLQEICEYVVEKGIYIIADEIYDEINYGAEFKSIPSFSDKIKENTILINGVSKSYSMTGWRIGYTASNPTIAKAMGSIQSHLTNHPSTISQQAAREAISNTLVTTTNMVETYKKRRDYIVSFFDKLGFDIIPPKGAFYLFVDMSPLKKYFEDGNMSIKLCEDLIEKVRVAFVPGISFGSDDYVRISYAASMEEIKEGLNRFKKYVEEINEN
ncbi:MAG: aspartate aminotransferase [Clostridiales bacterium]|nr:MAG: aspartate aminotransferase [Clostridiales bacterium]